MTVTLTKAIGGAHITLPVGSFAVEDGPHGGAVILYQGMRIAVVEKSDEVRRMMEKA